MSYFIPYSFCHPHLWLLLFLKEWPEDFGLQFVSILHLLMHLGLESDPVFMRRKCKSTGWHQTSLIVFQVKLAFALEKLGEQVYKWILISYRN